MKADRLAIGRDCEHLFVRAWERATIRKNRTRELDERWQALRAAQAENRQHIGEPGEVFEAIRHVKKVPAFVPDTEVHRVFEIKLGPRPRGKRKICRRMACIANRRLLRADITPRMIKSCWDEYRAFLSEIRPDD